MANDATFEIYVRLLGEGTECSRPARGVSLGHGLFRLLPANEYDREDEQWEFAPGSVVRVMEVRNEDGSYLLAIPADSDSITEAPSY